MSTKLDGSVFRPFIVGIDVDDTMIDTGPAPDYAIEGLRPHCREVMMKWWNQGLYLMINTCRANDTAEGYMLEKLLFEEKIPYHILNNHSVWSREEWGANGISRKLYAELYIDDKNLEAQVNGKMWNWFEIDQMVQIILENKFDKFGIQPNHDYSYHTGTPQKRAQLQDVIDGVSRAQDDFQQKVVEAQGDCIDFLADQLGLDKEDNCKFSLKTLAEWNGMNELAVATFVCNLEDDEIMQELWEGNCNTITNKIL